MLPKYDSQVLSLGVWAIEAVNYSHERRVEVDLSNAFMKDLPGLVERNLGRTNYINGLICPCRVSDFTTDVKFDFYSTENYAVVENLMRKKRGLRDRFIALSAPEHRVDLTITPKQVWGGYYWDVIACYTVVRVLAGYGETVAELFVDTNGNVFSDNLKVYDRMLGRYLRYLRPEEVVMGVLS